MRRLIPQALRTNQYFRPARRQPSGRDQSRQSGTTLTSLMVGMAVGIVVLSGTLSFSYDLDQDGPIGVRACGREEVTPHASPEYKEVRVTT